jgi:thiamine transport system substrate-binding protein
MKIILSIFTGLVFLTSVLHSEVRQNLVVYTYDSFNSDWGPGPQLEKAFENICDCDLKFVTAGDGAALLAKLRLEGNKTKADVVVGLDTNLLKSAKDSGLFSPHNLNISLDLPIAWKDETFMPFDWGYFSFVFDKSKTTNIPKSFEELAKSDLKIAIQDPRSSTPGLGLVLWIEKLYNNESKTFWRQLADNVVTVTPGWSEAYGLFIEGEVDGVLSYTTSPAYHKVAENDNSKVAAIFDEGHLIQIEVGAILENSEKKQLAADFLAFMTSSEAQSIIPTTNWMYPAKQPDIELPAAFKEGLSEIEPIYLDPNTARTLKESAIEVWKRELRK